MKNLINTWMREKIHNLFILVRSLLLDKLIQLSNPQPELVFHYASRILTSNHNQSTILTPKKKTKAPTLGSFMNISLREPYS